VSGSERGRRLAVFLSLLGLLAATAVLAGGGPAGPKVRVAVTLDDSGGAERVRVVARPAGEAASPFQEVREVTASLTAPGAVELELLPGRAWRIRAEATGFWSRDELLVPQPGSHVALRLQPAGQVQGQIAVDRNEKPPPTLAIRFQTPSGGSALQGSVQCPIQEGRFHCTLPAGRLDLRLRAKGFLSHYRWDAEVKTRGSLQLGTLALQRGASVVGWVESTGKSPLTRECQVQLVPRGAPANGARGDALTLGTRVNERGFFHFDGVSPGSYTAMARQPGFAPARQFPLIVYADTELELLRSLVLAPPASLEVVLDPPRDPWDQAWRIELSSTSELSHQVEPVASAESREDGSWRHEGLAPGTYSLQVKSGTEAIWHSQEIEIDREGAQLHVDLPAVRVRGSVRLGDQPLVADLWFGGKHGAQKVRLKSDESGEFKGVLPREGAWNVEIVSQAPKVHRSVPGLAVKKSPGAGEARVEIALPHTVLLGRVVRERGEPADHAIVFVTALGGQEPPFPEHAGADGEFRLEGLPPGQVLLSAQAPPGDETEAWTPAALADGHEGEPVTLTVRPHLTLSGTVASAAGGVPGARIEAWPARDPLAFMAPQATDVEGRFTTRLPPGTREVSLVVYPPGFALRALRLPVDPGMPVTLPVEAAGGTLVLESTTPLSRDDFTSAGVAALHNGVLLYYVNLRNWSAFNGQAGDPRRLVIPQVEAGEYTVCRIFQDEPAVLLAGGLPTDRCVTGHVPALGEAVLKVPPEPTRSSSTPPAGKSPARR
jgi:hypothetical protein